jgi:hypothetical protein
VCGTPSGIDQTLYGFGLTVACRLGRSLHPLDQRTLDTEHAHLLPRSERLL